jgi:hypothetical protein
MNTENAQPDTGQKVPLIALATSFRWSRRFAWIACGLFCLFIVESLLVERLASRRTLPFHLEQISDSLVPVFQCVIPATALFAILLGYGSRKSCPKEQREKDGIALGMLVFIIMLLGYFLWPEI